MGSEYTILTVWNTGRNILKLKNLMDLYQDHHTKTITKLTHFIGVPMIYFAVMIPLCWLHFRGLPLTWFLTIGLISLYCFFDLRVAFGSALVLVSLAGFATYCAGDQIHLQAVAVFLIAFIVGWLIQFVGHYFEGNRPALFDNLLQIFIAPAFVAAEFMGMLGLLGKKKPGF